MDVSKEATDALLAEVLVLRAGEEQDRGNTAEAQRLVEKAIGLVGEDGVETLAEECVIELPACPIRDYSQHEVQAPLAWHHSR